MLSRAFCKGRNGELENENGERGTGNGERGTENGKRGTGNRAQGIFKVRNLLNQESLKRGISSWGISKTRNFLKRGILPKFYKRRVDDGYDDFARQT